MPLNASNIRTLAVVGHNASGKTSLIDAALFMTKAADRHGRADQGSSLADCLPDEQERKTTIHAKPLHCQWKDHFITMLDTPGFADFHGEIIASVRAADAAIVVMDGISGVDVGTRRVWKLLNDLQKPRLIYISKLDKENSDFTKCVTQIQEIYGKNCVPFTLPLGNQASFSKAVTIVTRAETDLPAELQEMARPAREAIEEAAAEQDDALLEKYLGGERLTVEQIVKGAHIGVANNKIIPIYCGCAEKLIGLSELLDGIVGFLPGPAERPSVTVVSGNPVAPKPDAPFSGFVFKVTVDPFAGHLAYVRVESGTLRADMEVINATRGAKERVPQLMRLQGKTSTHVPEALPGEIVALAKLKDTHINDTLCDPSHPVQFPPIVFPKPVMSFAVHPHTAKDEEKISLALNRLLEEDKTLAIERNPNTHELVISGLGDIHIAVAVENMKRKLGVNVDLTTPKVDYKETITARAEGHYKHKKQSGGRGQYGEAYLKLEPRERGAGFEFVDEVVGGAIPRNFIPAVEKGCIEAMTAGVIAGFTVVDVRAIVYDGSYHDVDSNELSFKISGLQAFKEAMQKARPVLLEPIMNVNVYVPDQFMGDITGDLNHRRGRIMSVEPMDGMQCIKAQVPQSEIFRYVTELRSITGGRGTFEMEFSHYEQVPAHIAQKVAAEAAAAKKAEQ